VATIAELFDLAVRHHQRGDLAQAEGLYRQILQAGPYHADACGNLGAVLAAQGRYAEAIPFYRQALRIVPNHANAYSNLGAALKRQGELTEAIHCCRQALHINPDHADARYCQILWMAEFFRRRFS